MVVRVVLLVQLQAPPQLMSRWKLCGTEYLPIHCLSRRPKGHLVDQLEVSILLILR